MRKIFRVLLTEFSKIHNDNAIYSPGKHNNALNDQNVTVRARNPLKMQNKNCTVSFFVPRNKLLQYTRNVLDKKN